MPKTRYFFLFFSLTLTLLAASGCTIVSSGAQKAVNNTGGIFVSADKGTTWKSKSLIPTTNGKAKSFSGLDVSVLAMDPTDSKAVYFGSIGNGLYYTYNSGETWQVASGLGNFTINSIAVDPNDKCNIYLAISNKIFRSNDCNRTWAQIYIDAPKTTVDAIEIDHYNSSVIYVSISRGDLIKSEDKGVTWQTVHRLKDKIIKIVIDPNDSRIIYLVTKKTGAYYSRDGGVTWNNFNKALKDEKLGLSVRDIALVKSEPNVIYIATNNGILRSKDGADTWDNIELIPPEKSAAIIALAVNPNTSQEIYYITNSTFYRSLDGGLTWAPFKLPTDRLGSKLLLDPLNSNLIYLGVKAIPKK
jgi:photosystem II stability/assembly factor-like uncharacterized protein